MAQFNLSDYEEVKDRLPKFFKKYPDGRVITDLISDVNQIETVVFKATLYNEEIELSTGWAFEKAGEGFVNKTSHLENCETSAIGRALANITIHGDKRPSKEEMDKVERHTATNKTTSQQSSSNAQGSKGGSTEPQQKCIYAICNGNQIDIKTILSMYNVTDITELTKADASKIIKDLKEHEKNKTKPEAPVNNEGSPAIDNSDLPF